MNGTDISGLLNGNAAKGILQLIQLNNKPVPTFLTDIIKTLLDAVLSDSVLILKDIINPNITMINAMNSTIMSSLGVDLSSVTGMATGILNNVNSAISTVTTAITDAQTQADLIDMYAAITGIMKGTPSTVNAGSKYLNGFSYLYGAYNEYQFLYGTAPPLNTFNVMKANLIDEASMTNRLAFINSTQSAAVNTWLATLTGTCDFLDTIPGLAAKFTARDSITYNKANYCNAVKNYYMTDYTSKLTTFADIFKTLMISKIKEPMDLIKSYVEPTGIIPQISTVLVAILKGAFTAADTRFSFSYAQNVF